MLVSRNRKPGRTQGKERKGESALHGQYDRALLEGVARGGKRDGCGRHDKRRGGGGGVHACWSGGEE